MTERVSTVTYPHMTTAQERRQQERQARRRRIQGAAREVFAAKGYAKTSIEQVARQASLSVGAIYLYFRSKEDLYVSLLEETMVAIDTKLKEIRVQPSSNGLKDAWNYLSQWAETDIEGTRILRLISQPGIRKQLSDQVAQATADGLGNIREHLGALIASGISGGRYRNVSPAESSDLLWSLFLGVLQTTDARNNLGIGGATLAEASNIAFRGMEDSWLQNRSNVAEAAA